MLDQLLDSPLNIGVEAPAVLIVLVALEAVLSADNAIALAAIARGLEDSTLQRRALNIGLVFAYALRAALILAASWVVRFWQFELIGATYLLWLTVQYFASPEAEDHPGHKGPAFESLLQVIPAIAFTDLAFSLDSVTTAIAVSDRIWLVMAGGAIGVLALRFLAGLFIRLLEEFAHLEDAGYVTVGFVGLRLLVRVVFPEIVPPEWLTVLVVATIFAWGFSERVQPPQSEDL